VTFSVSTGRDNGDLVIITADYGDDIIGELELKKQFGDLYVKNLFVGESWRRKGIATALYEKAVEFARSEGTCVVSEQDMRNAKSDALHAHSLRKKLKHSYRYGKYRNSDVYCNPPSHSFHRIASALGYLLADDGFEFAHKIEAKHCPQADREHADSDRQYCHVGHRKDTICYAKATDDLTIEWKIGLAVHEFGHLILQEGQYYNHSEEEANEAGGQATGIPVDFKGKKHLEWSRCPVWFKEILDGH
jgi:GNAT superfamily N-acetyltransferase